MAESQCGTESQFADRLRELIGEGSVSAFARKVGLSEAILRKYLMGSEPSLSKANQIARNANCSLEWLATGCGYRYRQAEVVDRGALEHAIHLALEGLAQRSEYGLKGDQSVSNERLMKCVIAIYQYLRATKRTDETFDLPAATDFATYVTSLM